MARRCAASPVWRMDISILLGTKVDVATPDTLREGVREEVLATAIAL